MMSQTTRRLKVAADSKLVGYCRQDVAGFLKSDAVDSYQSITIKGDAQGTRGIDHTITVGHFVDFPKTDFFDDPIIAILHSSADPRDIFYVYTLERGVGNPYLFGRDDVRDIGPVIIGHEQ
jgi:hypothetical protein